MVASSPVDDGGSVVSSSRGSRVLGLSGVGHLSNVAGVVVSVVVHGLDPAVREVDRVGSLNRTVAIIGLGLAEGSIGVVISNSVGVGVGGGLGQVGGRVASSVSHRPWGVVGRGRGVVGRSVDYRGVVGRGRGVVDRSRSVVHRGGRGCSHEGEGDECLEVMGDMRLEDGGWLPA